jgi:hypothetical protein
MFGGRPAPIAFQCAVAYLLYNQFIIFKQIYKMANQKSLTLCGETHSSPMHICGFFDSEDERYEVILPYLKEGLENNEEVLNILESTTYTDHCQRLVNAGIPVK